MKIKILLLSLIFVISGFAGEVELIKDVIFGKGGDKDLKLDIYRPKEKAGKPMPALIYMHPGGWENGDKGGDAGKVFRNRYLDDMAARGYFGVTINYRLSTESRFPAQIEDCKCAVRFLRAKAKEYNIDTDHIGAIGGSAGGHLSALLGTTGNVKEFEGKGGWEGYSSKVQAVYDGCGPVDLYKWKNQNPTGAMLSNLFGGLSGKYKEAMDSASPIKHISKDTPPFLIVHGDKDEVVSVKQSQAFADALKAAGVEVNLIIVKGGPHGAGVDMKIIEDFFDKYLKK